MRKSITDFGMRRTAAVEVGDKMLDFYMKLPSYRKFKATPDSRFDAVGCDSLAIAIHKETKQIQMAHLLGQATADKEVGFLSPLVHSVYELSYEVDMSA